MLVLKGNMEHHSEFAGGNPVTVQHQLLNQTIAKKT